MGANKGYRIMEHSGNSFIRVDGGWKPPPGKRLLGNTGSFVIHVEEQGLVYKKVTQEEAVAAKKFQQLKIEGVAPVHSIYSCEQTLEESEKLRHAYTIAKFGILALIHETENDLKRATDENDNDRARRLNIKLNKQQGRLGLLEKEYSQQQKGSYFICMPYLGKDLLDRAQQMINEGRSSGPSANETFNALWAVVACMMDQGVFLTDMKKENVCISHGDNNTNKPVFIDYMTSVMPKHFDGEHVDVSKIPFQVSYKTEAFKELKAHGDTPLASDTARRLFGLHVLEATARTAVSYYYLTDNQEFSEHGELQVSSLMKRALSPLDSNSPVPKRARPVSTESLCPDENSPPRIRQKL